MFNPYLLALQEFLGHPLVHKEIKDIYPEVIEVPLGMTLRAKLTFEAPKYL
jgi:hypothetical protein